MQNILALETKKYNIKTSNFEGPLDLLCHLIDKNKMNIYDINISQITDQYIEYINAMEEMNLEIASEFLIMASTLIYMKSRGLLPTEVEDEKDLTEEELVRRIIEYKKYKEITKKLRERYEIYSNRFFKQTENIILPKQELEKTYQSYIIPEVYERLITQYNNKMNKNATDIERISISETVTITSKVKQIFRELTKRPKFVFNKLFSITKYNKVEIVTAFTGLLELTSRKKVLATQQKNFGDIVVEKRNKIQNKD